MRRQMELSRKYATEHGLVLDESLKPDRGISAFHGKNRTEGSLGAFLSDCKSGRVPAGSALLVESLDRLSREQVEEALYQLLDVIRAGIEVHTIGGGESQVYKKGALKTEQLMLSLFVMSRANEESQRKSERVGAAWRQKKSTANGTKAITAKVPLWLSAKLGEPVTVIPERAAVVKEIFRMAAGGMGKRLIARRLNEKGIKPWGKPQHRKSAETHGWRYSYVHKILHNRAVLGEFQPHKRTADGRVPEGETINNYFPRIITPAEWQAAHVNSKPSSGQVGKVGNLFTGLVFDDTLGHPMHFENKGGNERYFCTDSARFGKKPNRINYNQFEAAFLRFLDQLDWSQVLDVRDSSDIKAAEEEAARLTVDLERTEAQIQVAIDQLLAVPSKSLQQRLQAIESAAEHMREDRVKAERSLEEAKRKHRDLLDEGIAYEKLSKAKDFETRAKLRQEIRRKVQRIDVRFRKNVMAKVTFVNGAQRVVAWVNGRLFLSSEGAIKLR
jgi:DNA invertase Pin-like site-specific DNA recombinase